MSAQGNERRDARFDSRNVLSMRCLYLFHGRWTSSRVLSVAAGALATVASMAAPSYAAVVSFGSEANTFNMEFVTIGNAGNAADTDTNAKPLNAGAVGYTYDIGKFEVSEDMITKYNANFGTANNLEITKNTRSTAKPATSVTWNEAARFVNWLNTSTGNQAAYKFTTSGVNDNIALWVSGDPGYNPSNPYRNSLAKYVLPSYNEWYKAAYYDPNKAGGAGYWDYATGSNSAPTAVASGTATNTAVYNGQSGPAEVGKAGGLSPYDVMGLGGNVSEWEESSFELANSSGSAPRGMRGGGWTNFSSNLSSSSRIGADPSLEANSRGFRVASLSSSAPPAVPEPSMMVIGTLFGLGGLMAKRRMKK
jgi:sulfatase modifying factor 1